VTSGRRAADGLSVMTIKYDGSNHAATLYGSDTVCTDSVSGEGRPRCSNLTRGFVLREQRGLWNRLAAAARPVTGGHKASSSAPRLQVRGRSTFEDQYFSYVLNTPQATDNAGESAARRKHGFESRWGHHLNVAHLPLAGFRPLQVRARVHLPGYRRESVVAPSNFATLARRRSVHTGTGRKQLNQSRCNARRRVEETERQLSRISANRAPPLRSRGLVPRRTEDRHRRLRRTRFACPSPRRCVGAHRTPGVKGRDRRCG